MITACATIPSKLADCLCQTVRQCFLELGWGLSQVQQGVGTVFVSGGFSCVADGGSGDVPARSTKRCPNGFPEGFPMGFHGFPGVSSMTLSKTSSPSPTFFVEFCSSVSVKTGVSNASEWPYYNIRRPQVIGAGERVGAGPVSSVAPLCPLEF